MLIVPFREEAVWIGGRTDPANEAADIERVRKGANGNAVARPVLNRLHTGFEIDAECLGSRQRLQQGGLADAARPEDRHGGLGARGGKPLVSRDDAEGHHKPPTSRATTSTARSAPSAPACHATSVTHSDESEAVSLLGFGRAIAR